MAVLHHSGEAELGQGWGIQEQQSSFLSLLNNPPAPQWALMRPCLILPCTTETSEGSVGPGHRLCLYLQ